MVATLIPAEKIFTLNKYKVRYAYLFVEGVEFRDHKGRVTKNHVMVYNVQDLRRRLVKLVRNREISQETARALKERAREMRLCRGWRSLARRIGRHESSDNYDGYQVLPAAVPHTYQISPESGSPRDSPPMKTIRDLFYFAMEFADSFYLGALPSIMQQAYDQRIPGC